MKSYHFDLGNSNTGPIGCCARVLADSEEEARQKLIDNLPLEHDLTGGTDRDAIEYIEVYFNPDAIQLTDIDEVNDEEGREVTPPTAG